MSTSSATKVAIVEDHTMVADALAAALGAVGGLRAVLRNEPAFAPQVASAQIATTPIVGGPR